MLLGFLAGIQSVGCDPAAPNLAGQDAALGALPKSDGQTSAPGPGGKAASLEEVRQTLAAAIDRARAFVKPGWRGIWSHESFEDDVSEALVGRKQWIATYYPTGRVATVTESQTVTSAEWVAAEDGKKGIIIWHSADAVGIAEKYPDISRRRIALIAGPSALTPATEKIWRSIGFDRPKTRSDLEQRLRISHPVDIPMRYRLAEHQPQPDEVFSLVELPNTSLYGQIRQWGNKNETGFLLAAHREGMNRTEWLYIVSGEKVHRLLAHDVRPASDAHTIASATKRRSNLEAVFELPPVGDQFDMDAFLRKVDMLDDALHYGHQLAKSLRLPAGDITPLSRFSSGDPFVLLHTSAEGKSKLLVIRPHRTVPENISFSLSPPPGGGPVYVQPLHTYELQLERPLPDGMFDLVSFRVPSAGSTARVLKIRLGNQVLFELRYSVGLVEKITNQEGHELDFDRR
jgi:hypothetical protein